jgi:hypothetical protein
MPYGLAGYAQQVLATISPEVPELLGPQPGKSMLFCHVSKGRFSIVVTLVAF